MWLKASSTNNNPRCIAKYFVDCVRKKKSKLYYAVILLSCSVNYKDVLKY